MNAVTTPIMWTFTADELIELGVGMVERKKYLHVVEHMNQTEAKQVKEHKIY